MVSHSTLIPLPNLTLSTVRRFPALTPCDIHIYLGTKSSVQIQPSQKLATPFSQLERIAREKIVLHTFTVRYNIWYVVSSSRTSPPLPFTRHPSALQDSPSSRFRATGSRG